MQSGGQADRADSQREASDHRPPSPVGERQERGRGRTDHEKGDRLQQMRAEQAAGCAREARPAPAGGNAQDAHFGRLTETGGKHRVEEGADCAGCVHGLEIDGRAKRRPPRHRPQRLRQRDNDERRREQGPVGMRCMMKRAATQLERHDDEAGNRGCRDRPGEQQAPSHRLLASARRASRTALERGSGRFSGGRMGTASS